jgi:hypothetical protein
MAFSFSKPNKEYRDAILSLIDVIYDVTLTYFIHKSPKQLVAELKDEKYFRKDQFGWWENCECIKEALGQILLYSLNDQDERPKKHIVVGQYPATENDTIYINFLKKNLKLEFEYIHTSIVNFLSS